MNWHKALLRVVALSASGLIELGCGGSSNQAAATAAQGGQTYAQAIKAMCDVDRRAAVSPSEDPIEVAQKRNDWLGAHVTNPDAVYFRTLWRVKPPKEQAQTLRAEAKDSGLAACPLADTLEKEASD